MYFSILAHLLCAYVCVTTVLGQIPPLRPKIGEVGYELHREENELMFCVLSNEEMAKCQAFAAATARDHLRNEKTFGSYYRPILCKKYFSHDECMRVVDENSMQHPNIMTVDAGEVSKSLNNIFGYTPKKLDHFGNRNLNSIENGLAFRNSRY